MNIGLGRFMRKPAFCICKNKGAAQCLCFRYIDSIICPLLKFKITSLWLYIPVCARTGPKPRRQVFSRWGAAVLHDGVVCVFCSLAVVPELTLPTNNSRQRLSKLINVGVRGRSKSRTMSRYITISRYMFMLLRCQVIKKFTFTLNLTLLR